MVARCFTFPSPSLGERYPMKDSPIFPFCCYVVPQVLCIKPLLIKCWSTRTAKPSHWIYLRIQIHRVMTWPRNLKTRHSQRSVSNERLLKENRHLLDYSPGREFCPSQNNFNWYLRHLELLRILVKKKMAELNSLWYSCLILIYLFLTSIHNLLSTSLLRFNKYSWNNQLLHIHQTNV